MADKAAVLAALEGAGWDAVGILRDASTALRNDVEVVRAAVAQHGMALTFASEELKGDAATVAVAVAQSGGAYALRYASDALRARYGATAAEFLANAPQVAAAEPATAAAPMAADRATVLAQLEGAGYSARSILRKAPKALRNDAEVVRAAVVENGDALKHASAALRDDAATMRVAVAQSGRALQYASDALQNDAATVAVAVAKDGYALQYASAWLQSDAAIVRAAVVARGSALEFASVALKNDAATVRLAVAQSGRALKHASAALQNDGATVRLAVTKSGLALEHASAALRNDAAMVRAAVARNSNALEHASDAQKDDAETVRVAVAQNGLALRYASDAQKGDVETVWVAVAENGKALKHASAALRNDAEFMREAVAQDGWALHYASAAQKNDVATVRLAVAQHGYALDCASAALRARYGATAADFLANAPQTSSFTAADESESESESDDANELSIEDLHEAAEAGDQAKLRRILQAGVGVDVKTPEGATPLMLAAQQFEHGNVSKPCVKLLLQHNAKVDIRDADGWSALMFAAKADDADTVKLLCEANADMEIKDKSYGMTAFLLACENGCPEVVEALAECGANIKAKDDNGHDGKKLAEGEEPPHENVLELLKEIKQKSSSAAAAGDSEVELDDSHDLSDDDDAPMGLPGSSKAAMLAALAGAGSQAFDILQKAPTVLRNDAAIVRAAVAQNGWALEYASDSLKDDAATVRVAVAQSGRALQYASDEQKDDAATVRLAVAQFGHALKHASAAQKDDAATVRVAVAQNGDALYYTSDALKEQYGYTAAEFLANAPQAAAAVAVGNGATPADASSAPPAKRRKLDPQVEARLATMMQAKDNVASPPLNTLEHSAYLKCYQGCPAPRTGKHPWSDPLTAVADSLPRDFHKEEWEKALAESAGVAAAGSTLRQAGAACTRLWSKNAMFRLAQRVILEDDAQLLERIMPFIRCLSAFILDEKGLLTMLTTVYRASRMTKAQERQIHPGRKYRLGMFVATSTSEAAAEGLMGWQAGEMGSEVKYRWRFTIPKGCRQATKISDVSAYANEHEVLLVPYSAILVTGKSFDKETGMIQVDAEVLPDSMLEPLDLPTVTA